MSRDYRINTFGLTEEQNALVENNIPTRDYSATFSVAFQTVLFLS